MGRYEEGWYQEQQGAELPEPEAAAEAGGRIAADIEPDEVAAGLEGETRPEAFVDELARISGEAQAGEESGEPSRSNVWRNAAIVGGAAVAIAGAAWAANHYDVFGKMKLGVRESSDRRLDGTVATLVETGAEAKKALALPTGLGALARLRGKVQNPGSDRALEANRATLFAMDEQGITHPLRGESQAKTYGQAVGKGAGWLLHIINTADKTPKEQKKKS
jgi:hypothetical protein